MIFEEFVASLKEDDADLDLSVYFEENEDEAQGYQQEEDTDDGV